MSIRENIGWFALFVVSLAIAAVAILTLGGNTTRGDDGQVEVPISTVAAENPNAVCLGGDVERCYNPTPTPTPTATATPIPTDTPTPTPTATPFGEHCHENSEDTQYHPNDGANGHNHHPSAGAVVPCEPAATPTPDGQYVWVTNTPTSE